MYRLPILKTNTQAMLIRRQQLAIRNNARLMSSTHQEEQRRGINKGAIAAMFLTAAGIAVYYQRTKDEKSKLYQNDDPYEKTKKDVSQMGHDAAKEANKVGQQVKDSAESAGQATKDAYNQVKSSVQREGKDAVENAKDSVDKFRSEHHLKEGDRSPESIVSDKYNQTKETITDDIKKSKDYFANYKHRESPNSQDKNPMVHEKVSSDATKTPRERQLESYAENKVGDTSTLVNKDTNKVSSVWKDKDNQEKSGSRNSPVTVEHEPANNDNNKKKGFWNSIFGGSGSSSSAASAEAHDKSHQAPIPATPVDTSSKKDFQKGSSADGNPMVNEKRSRDRTKSNQEYHMEAYANDHVHDTSTLVGKDTEKVKGTWEDKASRDQGSQEPSTSRSSLTSSSWSNLVNQASEKLHEVEEKVENYIEDDGKKVASMWEGVKNKVGLSAKESYQDAKSKASQVGKEANDTLKDVSNKASHESGRLEEGWENVKSQAKEEADSIYRTASDVVSSTSSKFKEGADQTRRDSSKLMQDQMDRASGVLNETEREANKLKSDTEKTAKSWYAKGTEQAKDSYDSIKDTVDKDIQWTRQKVQEGLNNTKEEVSHLLSTQPKESDLAGHIKRGEKFAEEEEGQLRSTRNNVDKKPAKVVVEHADGKDM